MRIITFLILGIVFVSCENKNKANVSDEDVELLASVKRMQNKERLDFNEVEERLNGKKYKELLKKIEELEYQQMSARSRNAYFALHTLNKHNDDKMSEIIPHLRIQVADFYNAVKPDKEVFYRDFIEKAEAFAQKDSQLKYFLENSG